MTGLPGRLAQPDRRSCGAASLVVARSLVEKRPIQDLAEFHREVLEMHRHLTWWNDRRGEAQLPWPRRYGTPPWAAERELEAITGEAYTVRPVRDRRRAFERMVASASEQTPVAAYVGSGRIPRHVVLTIRGDEGGTWTYEPASGRVVHVRRARWVDGPVDLAGWPRWWGLVTPRREARRNPA